MFTSAPPNSENTTDNLSVTGEQPQPQSQATSSNFNTIKINTVSQLNEFIINFPSPPFESSSTAPATTPLVVAPAGEATAPLVVAVVGKSTAAAVVAGTSTAEVATAPVVASTAEVAITSPVVASTAVVGAEKAAVVASTAEVAPAPVVAAKPSIKNNDELFDYIVKYTNLNLNLPDIKINDEYKQIQDHYKKTVNKKDINFDDVEVTTAYQLSILSYSIINIDFPIEEYNFISPPSVEKQAQVPASSYSKSPIDLQYGIDTLYTILKYARQQNMDKNKVDSSTIKV